MWRIHPDGAVDQLAALDPNGFPNDLAFDDDGNLFVTDPFLGEIWKVDGEGNASVWASDPILLGNAANPALLIHDFGVDGIAFDKQKKSLYVNNLDYGEIVRIGVGDGGEAGEPEVFASDALLVGSDGIAFDHKGTLYVAVNGQDRLAAVSPEGDVTSLAVGAPLDGPSSLVFGTHGNDKKTLYVASFAISRALGTKPGAPHPGISSIHVPANGPPPDTPRGTPVLPQRASAAAPQRVPVASPRSACHGFLWRIVPPLPTRNTSPPLLQTPVRRPAVWSNVPISSSSSCHFLPSKRRAPLGAPPPP